MGAELRYNAFMWVLAIESSCDESAVAVVGASGDVSQRIRAQKIYSQIDIHKDYAGVVPELAARSHGEILAPLIRLCLEEAGLAPEDLHGIAATTGPGLMGGLLVGAMMGKALAMAWGKPFLGINHLEGHILTPRLSHNINYPYVALLTSGGHCMFVLVRGLGDYTILGQTRDDAAGEAFDKVAKLLDLGFPGGPLVEKAAALGNPGAYDFPRPLLRHSGCDLSFAGLKTAVRHCIEKAGDKAPIVYDVAASAQEAIGDTLRGRAGNALTMAKELNRDINQFVVVGGVAANGCVRQKLESLALEHEFTFVAPPLGLCTDNAAMIGWAAVERFGRGEVHPLDTPISPRWPLNVLN